MSASTSPRRTRPLNSTKRLGLPDAPVKRCTPAEKKADEQLIVDAQAAKDASFKQAVKRLGKMEDKMEVEQAEMAIPAKPVRPCARAIKKSAGKGKAAIAPEASSTPDVDLGVDSDVDVDLEPEVVVSKTTTWKKSHTLLRDAIKVARQENTAKFDNGPGNPSTRVIDECVHIINTKDALVGQVKDWALLVDSNPTAKTSSRTGDTSANSAVWPSASVPPSSSVSTKATTTSYGAPPPSPVVPTSDSDDILVGGFGDDEQEANVELERAATLLSSMKTRRPLAQRLIKISTDARFKSSSSKTETPTLKRKAPEPEGEYVSSSEVEFAVGEMEYGEDDNVDDDMAVGNELEVQGIEAEAVRGLGSRMTTKHDLWRRRVIPTLCLWAGAQSDVWNISKPQIAEALGHILPVVFPDQLSLTQNLNTQSKLVSIAYQQLCEWRHGVGSAAIALFTTFFADSSPDEAKTASSSLLEHLIFLYEDLDNTNPKKAFCSELMVQLPATTYLPAIKGFVQVPELDTVGLAHSGVKGIIGLCGAALERGLHLIKDSEIQVTNLKGKVAV
ncbi:hypothetical protein BDN67DRAFT_985639 [Paxillus ammoniavirescens]|nr:hypothetical protein BDN67DRAFT_985639 [Paxillus ammoniavirescens]